jgi:hypothetical protein
MPLTPVVGNIRNRAFQLGLETTFKTAVPATRRLPWTATPTVDPHWTFPTADTGTVDQAIAPYATAADYTIAATGQLAANDAPTIISAGVMGGLSLTTSGTAKTLTAQPASTTQDVFDTYTGEWFDDSTDAYQMAGGFLADFSLEYPQDLGPINFTGNWRFSKLGTYPATPTGALSVDTSPTYLYAADTEFYVNDSSGTIETTKLSDIAYGATFSVNNNPDLKRFMNGSNTRFQIAGVGRGERVVNFSLIGAKQVAWVAEATKWLAASATERFFGIKTTSTVNASAGIPYSLDIRMPGYWLTRAEQTINTNTAFELTAQNIYDTGLGYPFRMVSTSTRASL